MCGDTTSICGTSSFKLVTPRPSALIRHNKPRRTLEIGSGNSTLVSAAAASANRREGTDREPVAVDSSLAVDPGSWVDGLARYQRVDCRALPLVRFDELEVGVPFIYNPHLLPQQLAPGIWVHFHDMRFPHEYPFYIFWDLHLNEQYLLQALLIGNEWSIDEPALASLFLRPPRPPRRARSQSGGGRAGRARTHDLGSVLPLDPPSGQPTVVVLACSAPAGADESLRRRRKERAA